MTTHSENDEKPFMEGSGAFLKSSLVVTQGTFFLTSKRFMFCRRSGLSQALLGPLLMHLAKGSIIVFEIELSDIININSVKHGFAKKIVFTTRNHEEYAVQFTSGKDKWLSAIRDAIKYSNPSITVSQIGDSYSFSIEASSFDSSDETSDDTLAQLKKAKEKLDLGLISQADYNETRARFVNPIGKTSDEALAELKKAKEKCDLGIISQEEYNKTRDALRKFID